MSEAASKPSRRVCTTCAHLRDDMDPKHREHYVRCGWWDGRATPITTQTRWTLDDKTTSWLTRKVVFQENGARLPECPTWEQKA